MRRHQKRREKEGRRERPIEAKLLSSGPQCVARRVYLSRGNLRWNTHSLTLHWLTALSSAASISSVRFRRTSSASENDFGGLFAYISHECRSDDLLFTSSETASATSNLRPRWRRRQSFRGICSCVSVLFLA